MIVEILAIDECGNADAALDRVRVAFDRVGRGDVPIEIRWIRTRADAASTPFAGSPTIALDGVDLFPSDGRTIDLACRVYSTPNGLAGLPTIDQIIDRLDVVT